MKDICCYILWSEKLKKFYTGICQENLEDRISKHNNGFYEGANFTKLANDWRLFLRIDVSNIAHARRVEIKIKSMKSSKYIRNLKKYPELLHKIITQTT